MFLFKMIKFNGLLLPSFVIVFIGTLQLVVCDRSFVINHEKNSFYLNGKPFRYVSGSAHYFRVPREYWRDRLRKIRAAGLNAVSTYVEWSQHELVPGQFDFNGDLNVKKFIEMAREEDLFVILRPGPYICAERDMGGLPYWLLTKHPDVKLRTHDPKYTKYVERWMDRLMTELSPLLYGRGGPIIMVQVENEYGSYHSCDYNYTSWLRDLFIKHVKNDAVLFTTDGPSRNFLRCGKIPGVYATVDFGTSTDVKKAFDAQREFEPQGGPLVNSEFYPGWLTHWGEKTATGNTTRIVKTLREMLEQGANVNFYMFYGGSNFGFTAGANYGPVYQSDITSYDYDAPITEAGDLTEKYIAIRNIVHQYLPPKTNISVSSSEKGDYGEITLKRTASIFSPVIRENLGKVYRNTNPLPFEAINQNFGYLLYETQIPEKHFNSTSGTLHIKTVRDLAHVYFNEHFEGNMSREFSVETLKMNNINKGGKISVMVENLGRINFGPYINDSKGILSEIILQGEKLLNWNMTKFELKNLKAVKDCFENKTVGECDNKKGFTFYVQKFKLPQRIHENEHELDSFLEVSQLTKGLIFINDFNLGRYWSWRGPQYTLYVPGVYLKSYPNDNIIIVLEENIKTDYIKIKFRKTPIFI